MHRLLIAALALLLAAATPALADFGKSRSHGGIPSFSGSGPVPQFGHHGTRSWKRSHGFDRGGFVFHKSRRHHGHVLLLPSPHEGAIWLQRKSRKLDGRHHVLEPHHVLRPHHVLEPHHVLKPDHVLRPHHVLKPHHVHHPRIVVIVPSPFGGTVKIIHAPGQHRFGTVHHRRKGHSIFVLLPSHKPLRIVVTE